MDGGKVRARGKVWAKGQPEPQAWTIERVDPIGSVKGSAGSTPMRRRARRRLGHLLRQHQGLQEQVARCGGYTRIMSKIAQHTLRPSPSFPALALSTLALIARSDPGKRRLADVGRHAGPQHGLEHERVCRRAGTSRRRRTSSGSPSSARRPTATPSSPAASCSSAPTTKRRATRAVKGDKGVLMAFRESDGTVPVAGRARQAAAGRANDWPFQGICSSPLVEDGIVYYMSNRGERDGSRHRGLPRRRERRPVQGREAARARPTSTSSGAST